MLDPAGPQIPEREPTGAKKRTPPFPHFGGTTWGILVAAVLFYLLLPYHPVFSQYHKDSPSVQISSQPPVLQPLSQLPKTAKMSKTEQT